MAIVSHPAPFPPGFKPKWRDILEKNVALYRRLPEDLTLVVEEMIPWFVGKVLWESSGNKSLEARLKRATIDSFTTYGGDVWAVFDGDEAVEAWLFRPGAVAYQGDFVGLHLQDVFTKERMMLKLALRYDYQTGKSSASQIPATCWFRI